MLYDIFADVENNQTSIVCQLVHENKYKCQNRWPDVILDDM